MKMDIIEEVKLHKNVVQNKFWHNEIFYIALYGSQNYKLATENSDVDTKCMILPTRKEVILGAPRVSTDVVIPETGAICNVKDIREMFMNFYKGNINFVEILYSDYYIAPSNYEREIGLLRNARELIATRDIPNLFRMVGGMACQKYVAFDKPFESKKDILKKYGYDPKQLHHLVRLYYFLQAFKETGSFGKALVPEEGLREKLLEIKIHPVELQRAKEMREEYMGKIEDFIDEFTPKFTLSEERQKKRSEEIRDFLDSLAYCVIEKAVF